MTEDEAKKKWCPFARVPHGIGDDIYVSANRFGDGLRSEATQCIASACMAWRVKRISMVSGDSQTDVVVKDKAGNPIGYCGLAGRP